MSLNCFSTSYYISNQGLDANSGKSSQLSWKTLGKLNSSMAILQPGDSVLLKRGDIFLEPLVMTKSGIAGKPIYLGAYGSGKKPVVLGGKILKSWTTAGLNIWQADCPECTSDVQTLTVNGRITPFGKYPDDSFLYPDTIVSGNLLKDLELANLPDFTGGEIVARTERWVFDRGPITSKSNSSLTYVLENYTNYSLKNSTYYFLQNHRSFLSRDKEWAYSPAEKKIYFYLATNPASSNIEISMVDDLAKITANYVSMSDISFNLSNQTSLAINGDNLLLNNIDLHQGGRNGFIFNGSSIILKNSVIDNIQNNIGTISGNNFLIENNTFKNCSLWPGMGVGGDGSYYGVSIYGHENQFSKNRLDSVGYVGVSFGDANNLTIKNNFITNVCLTKDDGGAIYTWSDGNRTNFNRRITGNVILKSGGGFSPDEISNYAPSEGIYIDDRSNGVIIDSNTVAFCKNNGIFIHNSNDVKILNNLVYGNKCQLLLGHDNIAPNFPMRNLIVSNNTFCNQYFPGQVALSVNTVDNNYKSIGTFSNNIYASPFDKNQLVFQNQSSLEEWRALSNQDLNSSTGPARFKYYDIKPGTFPELLCESKFNTGKGCYYCYSPDNNCGMAWDNTNQLDGGSIKIQFTNPTSKSALGIISNAFSIQKGIAYRLSMSAKKVAGPSALNVYLRKNGGDYHNYAPVNSLLVFPDKKEVETILIASETAPDARIDLEVGQDETPVWVDNISFQQINLSTASINDSMLFLENHGNSVQKYNLANCYQDARTQVYSGSVSLAPYSGMLLFYKRSCILTGAEESSQKTYLADILYPNPFIKSFALTCNNKIKTVKIYNPAGVLLETKQGDSNEFGAELSAGLYIVHLLHENDEVATKKIVKRY